MNDVLQSNVRRSLEGDQEAFAALVTEHQSLVCSLTYAACGNVQKSEDLAQETFIIAWKNLSKLRDPNLFKSWLCGIARNVIRKTLRATSNKVEGKLSSEDKLEQLESGDPAPSERASMMDDSILVWNTLEKLPENYRVPMILYYREENSIQRVSELLDISQETVRQRLSRGRGLLKQEITKHVEDSLFNTRPSNAFTLAVVSALPAFTCTGMAAAGVGTSTAKGTAWFFGTSLSTIAQVMMGPLIGLLGGWFGYKMSMKAARSDEERTEIKKMSLWVCGLIAIFGIPLIVAIYMRTSGVILSDNVFIAMIIALCICYGFGLFGLIFFFNKRLATIRGKTIEQDPVQFKTEVEAYEYKSASGFLGLPWIHIHRGSYSNAKRSKAVAKGWIAMGDIALSPFFAAGSICVAPIAFGAMAVGGLAFGGLALGLFAAGGFAAGWLGVGGFAIGYQAVGGLTMGWQAAFGGVALAREFAVGGIANAMEANTALADSWFKSQTFLSHLIYTVQHRPWIWYLIGFSPLVFMMFVNFYKNLFGKKNTESVPENLWIIECPKCHKAYPLEKAGGFRFMASSFEKRTLGFCRSCRRLRFMSIRFLKRSQS